MKFCVIYQQTSHNAHSPVRVIEQTTGQGVGWINRYLDREYVRRLANTTLCTYAYNLLHFVRWWESVRHTGDIREGDLTESTLLDYVRFQSGQQPRPSPSFPFHHRSVNVNTPQPAKEALHPSEQDCRIIVDSIPGHVVTLTAHGDIEFVNQTASRHDRRSSFIPALHPGEGCWQITLNHTSMLLISTTFVVDLYRMLDLRSKARQRLLAYYFTNATARHHLRDLAVRLRIDPSNLSKELGRLEREGLFRSEVSGRQKYFQLNREYPLFDEVRNIVAKTIGAVPLITQSLKKIEGMDHAYLYGSFARNQQDAASDIDVLVIGAPREEVLAEAVRKLERQLGREVNYTVLTRREFDSRRARKDAFLENVWRNKRVSLIGPHEKAKAARR